MGKFKTDKQQLSQDSFSKLRFYIGEQTGWVVREVVPDFGVDGSIDIFEKTKEGYKVTPYLLRFQLKATAIGPNKESFKISDIETWRSDIVPFLLFFWNKDEKKFYWINIDELYSNLEVVSPEKLQQKTVTVSFENELNDTALETIGNLVKTRYKYVNEVKRRNKGKELTVGLLSAKRGMSVTAIGYSMEGMDLSKQKLAGSIMMGVDLQDSSLDGVDLRRAAFMGANFNRASLRNADLRGTSLMGAYFEGADLSNTKLQGATFMGAFVESADFRGAELDDISLWSIGRAYDWEKAKFDKGIIAKIRDFRDIKNLSSGNLRL